MCKSFNPRLRTGGDLKDVGFVIDAELVSIHASAREATNRCPLQRILSACFNPRLRTGGDRAYIEVLFFVGCFNPRLRTGGERLLDDVFEAAAVSIHASAREATPTARQVLSPNRCFNPRLRTGGDCY